MTSDKHRKTIRRDNRNISNEYSSSQTENKMKKSSLRGWKFTASSGMAKGGCVGQIAYRRKITDLELSEDIVRKTNEAYSKEKDSKKREPK